MKIDITTYKNIVILTGAGVSAGSGLETYRGQGGVWDKYNVEEYGNVQALHEHPERTWQLFGSRRASIIAAKPNAAHFTLAKIEQTLYSNQNFLLVTQNIDGLHQRAGSKKLVELHGNIGFTRCMNEDCELKPFADQNAYADCLPICPICGSTLRPDIVLFGEMLPLSASWQAKKALRDCDLFIAIGTSGLVSPASSFVRSAEYVGARTIYINLEPMKQPNSAFKEVYLGKAELLLPELFGVLGLS